MKNLNFIIFIDLLNYLIKKSNFKRLLEISLISKSTFKMIQNIISFKSKECEIQFSYESLYKYFAECCNTTTTDTLYKFKLIQYNDIESISISDTTPTNDLNTIYKSFTKICKNLKNINLINKFSALRNDISIIPPVLSPSSNDIEFTFDRIELNWEDRTKPFQKDDFQFLSNYKDTVKKFYISSRFKTFLEINSILNHSYSNNLTSIKFSHHLTPINFLKILITSEKFNSKIKSLAIMIDNNYDFQDNNYDIKIYRNRPDEYLYQYLLFSGFSHNNRNNTTTNLKRLRIKEISTFLRGRNPELLFKLFENNYSNLNSLGLEYYNIVDKDVLNPLLLSNKLSNINTLYCNFNNLKIFLNHIIENKNIKKLNINLEITYCEYQIDQDFENMFKQFFNSNNTLEYLIFRYDYEPPYFSKFIKQIKKIKKTINNNKIIIIKGKEN